VQLYKTELNLMKFGHINYEIIFEIQNFLKSSKILMVGKILPESNYNFAHRDELSLFLS
jgi:hypothetical protein